MTSVHPASDYPHLHACYFVQALPSSAVIISASLTLSLTNWGNAVTLQVG